MNKNFRIIIGLIVSAACLWFVFKGFDFNELGRILRSASYGWMVPAALVFVLNITLRSLRWKILLSPIKKIPFMTVSPALILGFFMNNILPARGGELVRAVALSKKTDIPLGSVLGSVVAERLSDMLGLLMIVMMASRLLPWDKLPVKPIASILIVGILVLMVLFYISKKSEVLPLNSSPFIKKILGLLHQLTAGFMVLKSFSSGMAVVFLSLIIWIDEVIIALFISRAVLMNLNIFESAGLLTGISVGVMIPAAPGFVGTYEFFGKSALVLLGKPESESLALVVILHFFQLLMMAIIALPSFLLLSKTSKENV